MFDTVGLKLGILYKLVALGLCNSVRVETNCTSVNEGRLATIHIDLKLTESIPPQPTGRQIKATGRIIPLYDARQGAVEIRVQPLLQGFRIQPVELRAPQAHHAWAFAGAAGCACCGVALRCSTCHEWLTLLHRRRAKCSSPDDEGRPHEIYLTRRVHILPV